MARSLVLVDLDQFLGWKGRTTAAELVVARLSAPPYRPLRGIGQMVVVLAFNTTTAQTVTRRLGPNGLNDLAATFGGVVAGSGVLMRAEFSLSLTMPEMADAALTALAKSAPDASGAGRFQTVVVFSRDTGLRETVGTWLGIHFQPFGNSYMRRGGASWLARGTHDRAAPSATTSPSFTPATPPAHSHEVYIEDPALAAWAWGLPPGIGGGTRLDRLALKVEAEPSLLTQIGLTWPPGRCCTLGVDRLTRHFTAPPGLTKLGPCSHDDGLELRLAPPPSGANWFFREVSPLGPGAVRLQCDSKEGVLYLTARTRMPAWVFSPGTEVYLSSATPGTSEDWKNFKEHFRQPSGVHEACTFVKTPPRSPRACFCELKSTDPMRPPVAWWWWPVGGEDSKAKAKVPLPASILLPTTIQNVPAAAISRNGCLGYAYEQAEDTVVRCPTGLEVGAISEGLLPPADKRVAIFAPFPGGSNCRVTARAIQAVNWDNVREDFETFGCKVTPTEWADLQMLPLLVALDEVAPPRALEEGGDHDA